ILLLLVGMFLINSMSSARRIEYSEFYTLHTKGSLKKVVLIGAERIEGEVKEDRLADLPSELRRKMPNGKFTVQRPRFQRDDDLVQQLNSQILNQNLQVSQTEDHFAWMTPVVMMLLPAVAILALFFFLLPRFRDPLSGGFLSNYIKSP